MPKANIISVSKMLLETLVQH